MRDWILQRYRAYGQRLLLAALFCAPVAFHRGTADVFNLVKLWIIWIFGLCAVWVWFAWSLERGLWLPRSRLAYAAMLFLAAYATATAFSQNKAVSLVGIYHRYGGLVPLALYVSLTAALIGLFWEQPGRLKAVAGVVAFASAILSSYILIQRAGQDWIAWRSPEGGIPQFPLGTLGNSNFAGGYLGIALPFVVLLIVTSKHWRRYFYMGVLALSLIALWAAGSRGGMIGAIAGLGAGAFFYRDRLGAWTKRGMAVLGVAVTMLAVLVVWHPGFDEPPGKLAGLEVFRTETFRIRQYYWTAALRIFKDHPVVGTGPDTFFSNYGRYRLPADGAELGLSVTDKPHNIFLEHAANTGAIGLGSYLLLVGLALGYGFRQARRKEDSNRPLVICFASAWVAYLAQGFFSIDVPPLAFMGWIALGGLAVLADPAILQARTAREAFVKSMSSKKQNTLKRGITPGRQAVSEVISSTSVLSVGPRRGLQLAGAVLTLALVAAGSRPLLADIRLKKGQTLAQSSRDAPAQSDGNRALDEFKAAVRLYPFEAAYYTAASAHIAAQLDRTKDPEQKTRMLTEARQMLLKAQKLEPNNVFVAMNIARLYVRWAEVGGPRRLEQAQSWWSRAVRLDPTNWQLRFNYAAFLSAWGVQAGSPPLVGRSIEEMEKIAKAHPNEPRVWKALGQSHLALGKKDEGREALSRALAITPRDPSLLHLMRSVDQLSGAMGAAVP